MAKKPAPKKDRHKPRRMIGVRHVFSGPLERLAELLGTDVTQEVNAAVRERLERHGLWPPKPA